MYRPAQVEKVKATGIVRKNCPIRLNGYEDLESVPKKYVSGKITNAFFKSCASYFDWILKSELSKFFLCRRVRKIFKSQMMKEC